MKLIVVLMLILASGCGKESRDARPVSKNEQELLAGKFLAQRAESCETFRRSIPADWIQGTIRVPEDAQNPSGPKVSVFYYGKILQGQTPVIFFNGGPGFGSGSSFRDLKDLNQSIIFMDQRGTGCSEFYPLGTDPATFERLRHYGSRAIVHDAEAIRARLLGTAPWIAVGQSYGGFIVHRYLTLAPRSLRAAFSHGNALTDDGYGRIKNRVASHFRVLKNYLKAYPDDEQRIRVLAGALGPTECYTWRAAGKKVCGYALLDSMPAYLSFRGQWVDLHGWLARLVPEKTVHWKNFDAWVDEHVFWDQSPYRARSHSFDVISSVDRNVPPIDSSNCRRISDELSTEGLSVYADPLNECAPSLQGVQDPAELQNLHANLKKDPLKLQTFTKVLEKNPGIGFYLYSGEHDQTVPRENFDEEVSALGGLPNFFYKNFSDSGHDGYFTEPLVWEQVRAEATVP